MCRGRDGAKGWSELGKELTHKGCSLPSENIQECRLSTVWRLRQGLGRAECEVPQA